MPPVVDTCHWAGTAPEAVPVAPGGANGRTKISIRPHSFEWYATHRPSGENAPYASRKGVFRNTVGVRSPVIGTTQRSPPVCGSMLRYSRKRPSADQLLGDLIWSVDTNRSSAAAPFVSRRYRS